MLLLTEQVNKDHNDNDEEATIQNTHAFLLSASSFQYDLLFSSCLFRASPSCSVMILVMKVTTVSVRSFSQGDHLVPGFFVGSHNVVHGTTDRRGLEDGSPDSRNEGACVE